MFDVELGTEEFSQARGKADNGSSPSRLRRYLPGQNPKRQE